MEKILLVYGFNNFQIEQLNKAFNDKGFEIRPVPEEKYGYKIGELTGVLEEESEHEEGLVIQGRMVVVCGVDKEEYAPVFKLLTDTTGKLAYHKAVVTETNTNWTSARLFTEVDNEYKEIKKRNRLKNR